MPHYLILGLFLQLILDPDKTFRLALLEILVLTCGITTRWTPKYSLSTRTPTKPFVSFCWPLRTNFMSDPFAINTLATARQLHAPYLTIFTPLTPTFMPPPSKTTTRNSGLSTTETNFLRPSSIRSKMRWTTPP